jgi:transcriptional regulator with XRE-family HTH domain
MPSCSHITDTIASVYVRETANDCDFGWPYNTDMADRPPHYLREWRKHRKMTQQELADAINTSKSAVSDLERFNLQLSPKWLNRIAPVLKTQPGYILDHDPEHVPADVIDIWSRIPERDRDRAARVLREFTRTGTDD